MLALFRSARLALRRSYTDLSKVRNIGISAHIDSGKTTFSERVLFYTGKIESIHEVKGSDSVGATMDFMELEKERGITIQSAATFCAWKEAQINLIDTPGHVDFTIEVERALRVLDGGILLVCGSSGVQSQTLTVDRQMKRYKVPRLIFINKLDRAGANHTMAINGIRDRLQLHAAPLQLPIGLEASHKGLVDLIVRKAVYFDGKWGETLRYEEIPENMREQAATKREELIEALAEVDEPTAEMYLNGKTPSEAEIKAAIRRTTISRKFVPILMGSAYKNKGVQLALDAVWDYLPAPNEVENRALDLDNNETEVVLTTEPKKPLVALAFKLEESQFGQLTYMRVYQGKVKKGDFIVNTRTKKRVKISRMVRMHAHDMIEIQEAACGDIAALFGIECNSGDTFTDGKINYSMTSMFIPEPVMSLSIRPTKKDYVMKFNKAINRFMREDPTFRCRQDEESGETVISGMGELHLQIYAERMRREYGIDVELGPPTVNYRETVGKRADFNYLHKKQTGGNGQYAGVIGHIEPIPGLKPGELVPSKFVDATVGMNIGPEYIAAVQKSFLDCAKKGPQVGYPVLNTQYVLRDGMTHIVDSNSNAFNTATKASFRLTFPNADPKILEPVMTVEITVPPQFQTAVMGGIVKRRAFVKNTDTREDGLMVIYAEAPLSKMFGYATELRSNTQGQGEFSMEFLRMDPVAGDDAAELRASYQEKLIREKGKSLDE